MTKCTRLHPNTAIIPALNRATERKAKIRGGDAVGELVAELDPLADGTVVCMGAGSVLVCRAMVDEGHGPKARGGIYVLIL